MSTWRLIRRGARVPSVVAGVQHDDLALERAGERERRQERGAHAAAPTTTQRRPRKRAPDVARRTSISALSAAPDAGHAPVGCSAASAIGDEHRERRRPSPAPGSAVAGAEEDAVEREDARAGRLHQREQRPQRAARARARRVAGERARQEAAHRQQRDAEHAPRPATESSIIRRAAAPRAVGVARAERPPDDDLAGDRDRVEHQRQEEEQLEGDLVRGERVGPTRASTAPASMNAPSSEPVRTTSAPPIRRAGGSAPVAAGASAPARAAAARANAAPIPACAITVPSAEPGSPQSKP